MTLQIMPADAGSAVRLDRGQGQVPDVGVTVPQKFQVGDLQFGNDILDLKRRGQRLENHLYRPRTICDGIGDHPGRHRQAPCVARRLFHIDSQLTAHSIQFPGQIISFHWGMSPSDNVFLLHGVRPPFGVGPLSCSYTWRNSGYWRRRAST